MITTINEFKKHLINENNDSNVYDRIKTFLSDKEMSDIFAVAEDLLGSMDDKETVSEWNDTKNDLDKTDIISWMVEVWKNMNISWDDFAEIWLIYTDEKI